MIYDVILPQLGMGMSEGKPVRWLVSEGARVERDQPIIEIETEKVTTELPAPYTGFVHFLASLDQVVPIETLLAKIADTESEYHAFSSGGGLPSLSPKSVDHKATAGPTAGATTPREAGQARQGPKISGAAKKLAEEHSIAPDSIRGTGPGGRIQREDVLAAIAASSAPAKPAGMREATNVELARIPLTGARKVIADRTHKSKVTAAHTYGYFEIDITKLNAERRAVNEQRPDGQRLSLLSVLTRATALACREVPICNSTLVGTDIIVWKGVNIGIVVSLPGKDEFESNLVAPVLRDAQDKSVETIDTEIKVLAAKAREGRLSLEDTSGGTITLSSVAGFFPGLWALGTPLLALPQVFAFQPGGAIDKPVVVDGQIVVRTMLPCSVSFDHRAMDGEPVGRFVTKLAALLGDPATLTA